MRSIAIGEAATDVGVEMTADDLDCMVAQDTKWQELSQDQFAACEAAIDILQRLR